jgi:predicted RNA-binding Zn-ribbon protein involved in translation (DUF1610 family)
MLRLDVDKPQELLYKKSRSSVSCKERVMKCPNCGKAELETNEELSRGMGNQRFMNCPECGTIVLISGDVMTQIWSPDMIHA